MKKKKKVIDKKNITKEVSEFKEFITRGNVLDMAIGVIMGNAFGKIVTSIVNDILMPTLGLVLGGLNFSSLSFKIKDTIIPYGNFIQNVIDFLIISICLFVMIKFASHLTRKKEDEKVEEAPKKSDEVLLLEEIRDLLKK